MTPVLDAPHTAPPARAQVTSIQKSHWIEMDLAEVGVQRSPAGPPGPALRSSLAFSSTDLQ